MIPVSIANRSLENSTKFLVNPLDSNKTNIVKDIFIFSTKDIQKK